MAMWIIREPIYETSAWYQQILGGLMAENKTKRVPLRFPECGTQFAEQDVADDDVLVIIGSNVDFVYDSIEHAAPIFGSRIIVLGNMTVRGNHRPSYSVICSDINEDIRTLYNYLRQCGRERIALFGANPHSLADKHRISAFLACGGEERRIYGNTVSNAECYARFRRDLDECDAVICVNDYAAILLLKRMSADGVRDLFVTTCGGTTLSRIFTPGITGMRCNYEGFGRTCFDVYRLLRKNTGVNAVDVRLQSEFFLGETTNGIRFDRIEKVECAVPYLSNAGSFYEDVEVREMMVLERLLSSCDATDLAIIDGLLSHRSQGEMAERLFMSVNGIKYRLRRMYALCGMKARAPFIDFVRKYTRC